MVAEKYHCDSAIAHYNAMRYTGVTTQSNVQPNLWDLFHNTKRASKHLSSFGSMFQEKYTSSIASNAAVMIASVSIPKA
jgi:hypothetical protein